MADYEDTKVADLVINNMSQEKFEELKAAGELDPTQIYLTPTEESGGVSGDYLPLTGGTLTGALEFEWSGDYLATKNTILKTKYHRLDNDTIKNEDVMSLSPDGAVHFNNTVQSSGFFPNDINKLSKLGSDYYCFGNTFTQKINAGRQNDIDSGDLIVPTEGGTLARIEDINNIVEVLPTAENGYTTVKNYGNGYVEITGYTAIGTVGASTGSEVQIDLPAGYTMANANYWVNIAPTSETTMFDFKAEAKARSTTHFMVAYKNEDTTTGLTAAGVYWEVRGMLATE